MSSLRDCLSREFAAAGGRGLLIFESGICTDRSSTASAVGAAAGVAVLRSPSAPTDSETASEASRSVWPLQPASEAGIENSTVQTFAVIVPLP